MENMLQEIKEKLEQISLLKEDIKTVENKYAEVNRKFNKGDVVISNNIKDTIFEITGNFQYSIESDLIYVECKPITSSNKYINLDKIYSISESQLILQNNG